MNWSIEDATVITPDSTFSGGCIVIEDGKIGEVVRKKVKTDYSISIDNAVICPGLINSHDHLLGTYFPKVGNGPYPNWLPWDNDLKSADVYRERQQIENRDLYLLGGYRNLISGVTSVQDHIPHFVQDPFLDLLPVKVISDFSMAHSIASFALNWGEGVEVEYQKSVKNDIPFITHISEGFDDETVRDIETLDKKGGLGEYSVLIHGISFSESDMNKIKSKKANVVWCCDSNIFMFEKTTDIKMLLDKKINVSIGTDSPMSGGLNILEEMRFDRAYFKKKYGVDLPDRQIVQMVTKNPAKSFRMYNNGEISAGRLADLTVFEKKYEDPYSSVVGAGLKDIKLVIIEGMPVYGDAEYLPLFTRLKMDVQSVTVDGKEKVIIGDLKGVLSRINKAVGYNKKFPFLPVKI
ncbi:MAG: amidohydrolase family protein [Spirochaetes bacterium]|nr:amidohydrolase family protein [Spirochaetota bacterium]